MTEEISFLCSSTPPLYLESRDRLLVAACLHSIKKRKKRRTKEKGALGMEETEKKVHGSEECRRSEMKKRIDVREEER